MADKKPVALIGRLAIQLKLIDMNQLNEATASQAATGEPRLGNVFLEMGFINAKQLTKLEEVQKDVIAKHRAKQQGAGGGPASPSPSAGAAPKPTRSKQEILAQAANAARAASPTTSDDVAAVAPPAPSPFEDEAASAPAKAPPAKVARPDPAAAPPTAAAPAPPAQAPPPPTQQAQPAPMLADTSGEPSLELTLPEPDPAQRERLERILADGVSKGASDVHIHSAGHVKLRINGEFVDYEGGVLDRDSAEAMVAAMLSPGDRADLLRDGEIDYCLAVDGVGRFRANAYRQQRGTDVVYRSIPAEPPSLADLGLPLELAKYTNYHQGMVLVTGPAGCGKSSTLAAMVNLINEEREEHILSVEDPIEVLHESKRCIVNQRHAGRHTTSFARALRGALREDPDVIVIGELRDLETISLAMTAAETGHFVLATLHTNNAVRTINRMIGAFPSDKQSQVRTMLSVSLRAVISQRLVPKKDASGRVPALEVLVINRAIGNLIRDEKTVQIRSAIQTGKAHGMYLLEQSLNDLVANGTITRELALQLAEEKKLITAGG